ncbi:MAG: fructose-1,6-bisphosphatase [Lachnospiraceae bacterium]|nr:fructose-1,6-bisphosphatase [Lachnospiraceae bacterium]MDD7333568.1 fructose-1,6-bisphosphatase [Lachnospiraceae bacterium]MDY3275675.1 fructose-1,6-bisphosphatase [Agathobacter sp.]MDY5521554.1 fructose-1,6-bisphosphatase [Agathobacter sp.]
MEKEHLRYLEQLSELYPTIGRASTEIINLQSILYLPKGTEHFLSDLHGEFKAFSHVLRNGSGAVRKKIDDVFGHTLSTADKASLATLIYYPQKKMELVKRQEDDIENWYKISLYRLIEVCKTVSSKYTRSKVRKMLPEDYAYVIEELITEKQEVLNKEAYYEAIVNTIVELGQTENFIIALAELIQRLVIDHLHILGDIYDRGPSPDLIMDRLERYHSFDLQWGNHDIVWMGAAAGQLACIATVVRTCIRYGNLALLEEGYGINMVPLATFAMDAYRDDPCEQFVLKDATEEERNQKETEMNRKMHKAIAILRFKLEGQLIYKYPEWGMENRCLLHRIDYENKTVEIDGKIYPMLDTYFPTIDPDHPYELTEDELEVMNRLRSSFIHCEKLQRHVRLMLKKGSMYRIYNGNLLYHGCVPMNEDGSFAKVLIQGKEYSGKVLYDVLESFVRKAFFSMDPKEKELGRDMIYYIWTAPNSPLYGRSKMATFERYFLADKKMHHESKNAYYHLLDKPETAEKILKEFGLEGARVHIINGHVPVERVAGESPVKCNGKLILIDGGFSKTYRRKTGIAGYTLTYNSYGLTLSAHEPFDFSDFAVRDELDIISKQEAVEYMDKRILVGDTDYGKRMMERIEELKDLIRAYQSGEIAERDDRR